MANLPTQNLSVVFYVINSNVLAIVVTLAEQKKYFVYVLNNTEPFLTPKKLTIISIDALLMSKN